jgi:hypothetical protein
MSSGDEVACIEARGAIKALKALVYGGVLGFE